jgi:uncharacterized membrane protein
MRAARRQNGQSRSRPASARGPIRKSSAAQNASGAWINGAMSTIIAQVDSNLKWYIAFAVLSVATIIGIWMVSRVIREAKGEVDETIHEDDLLSPLAQAYAAGQMSKDEYRRILDSIQRGGTDVPLPARKTQAGSPAASAEPASAEGPSAQELSQGPSPGSEPETCK